MDRELYELLSKFHIIHIIDHPFLSLFILIFLVWLLCIIGLTKKHNKINNNSVDLIEKTYHVKENELKLEASIVNIISNIYNNRIYYYPEIIYYIDNQEFRQVLNTIIPIKSEYKGVTLYRKTNLMFQEGDKIEIIVNRYNLNEVYSPTLLSPEKSKYTKHREDLFPGVLDSLSKKILLFTVSFIFTLFYFIAALILNLFILI